ncbi:MAG: VanZ family protein [Defluviitaleaceae bacterium]|nr:VanZ family protein [Defluviitaleaceae bacterium]
MNKSPNHRTLVIIVFIAYAFAVCYITLFSREVAMASIELDPIASYRRAANTSSAYLATIEIRNVILNVIMFVPFGIFLPLFSSRLKLLDVIMLSVLASLAIETAQLITKRGVFAIEDIIHNTLGAALGLAFYHIFAKIFKKS